MRSVVTFLKPLAESALAHLGPAWWSARRAGPRDLILAYHNVVPADEDPGADHTLHLSLRAFVAHLDALSAVGTVVPLEEILAGPPRDGLRVAITFDDAYHGAMTAGLDELRAREMPSTVFVAPGKLDGGTFWWDRFPQLVGQHDLRAQALEREEGDDGAVTRALRARGWREVDPPRHARGCGIEVLEAALESGLVTLGAHSWSHANLAALSGPRLEEELVRPLEWLRERFPDVSRPWLAYPYGSHSARARDAALQAGYTFGFRVEGGFVRRPVADLAVPRLNVPSGLSLNGLRLRTSGVWG